MTDPTDPTAPGATPAAATPAGATPAAQSDVDRSAGATPAAQSDVDRSAGATRAAGTRSAEDPTAPLRRALLPGVVLLVAVVGGLIVFGLGSSKSPTRLPGNVGETPAGGSFAGGTLVPAKAAPATTLRNYLGQTVSLSQYLGKAVFVTFLYTRCPDVCPLIATNLHATQVALGPTNDKVQMIAISVDPKGDTPGAVASFLRVHKLVGRIQYLVGSAASLGRVWAAWHVGSARDAASPALVDHSALVYGITATGSLTTIYPAQFRPSDLVHDAPLLLGR